MSEENKPEVSKGRGGKNNFPNSRKNLIKTDEDRKLVSKLLNETIVAYKQERVKSDEELISRLDAYFEMCADKGQIPTVEEMCLFVGYSGSTLLDWEYGRNKGFSVETSHIIKKAKGFLMSFDAKLVVCGKLNFLAYCFRAKNYYGMKDTQDVVITPNNPMGDTASQEEIQNRLLNGTIKPTMIESE